METLRRRFGQHALDLDTATARERIRQLSAIKRGIERGQIIGKIRRLRTSCHAGHHCPIRFCPQASLPIRLSNKMRRTKTLPHFRFQWCVMSGDT
jgi:hypothetical protein